jgi:hypothetical protein
LTFIFKGFRIAFVSEKEVQSYTNKGAEGDLLAVSRWSKLYGIGAGVTAFAAGQIAKDWNTSYQIIENEILIDRETLMETLMLGIGLLVMGVSLMREGQPFERLRTKFQTPRGS